MIELRSTPKWQDGALPRAVAPADTYRRLKPLMPSVGIAHLIDITTVDVLGIPVFAAFSPLPADVELHQFLAAAGEKLESVLATVELFPPDSSSPDMSTVLTAGKGLTPLDAKVSAMMEAVERYAASHPTTTPVVGSYRQMKKRGDAGVVNPRKLTLLSPATYDNDQELEWVVGIDLCSGDEVWVPADASTLFYQPRKVERGCSDTPTGLGAGNSVEEAVCHGLAEAIEHDAWTLAIARSSVTSAQNWFLTLLGKPAGDTTTRYETYPSASQADGPFPSVDLDTLEGIEPVDSLLTRIRQAGAQVDVQDITSDIGIPTFSVYLSGLPGGPDGGGLGSHPDARLALSRALTEAAQQRLVLGLSSLSVQVPPSVRGQRAVWEQRRASLGKKNTRRFDEAHSCVYQDILDDIQHMMNALAAQGLDQVIVVDLTKPEINIPVVKVIVPELADFWTSDAPPQWEALGPRVMRYLR